MDWALIESAARPSVRATAEDSKVLTTEDVLHKVNISVIYGHFIAIYNRFNCSEILDCKKYLFSNIQTTTLKPPHHNLSLVRHM